MCIHVCVDVYVGDAVNMMLYYYPRQRVSMLSQQAGFLVDILSLQLCALSDKFNAKLYKPTTHQ